jgi:hypothetical protein
MRAEGAFLAEQLVRQIHLVRRELRDLPDGDLNRVLDIQPTNTLFQLGTHIAGSARYWAITNTGGANFHRDRDSEFNAIGTNAELLENLDALINQITDHVTCLTAEQLEQPCSLPTASFSFWESADPLPQRHALLHALEHTGLHLGHIQITRQILGYDPVKEE